MPGEIAASIVQAGAPVLREQAPPVSLDDLRGPEMQKLIEDMRRIMREAPGVGLAAPQIGLSLALAVIEDPAGLQTGLPPEKLAERSRRPVPFHVIVNPKLTLLGEPVEFFEGCLSLTGFMAIVPRSSKVRVECWNAAGEPQVIEAEGWYARILQHEIDHLNGTLYIDRMRSRSFMSLEHYRAHWEALTIPETIAVLGG